MNQVYVFMVRWHIGTHQDWKKRFEDFLKRNEAVKSVYQLEMGEETKALHIQGFVKLKNKIRAHTLAEANNDLIPGSCVQPASAAGKTALETYSMKAETRVEGPWGYPTPPYMGKDLACMANPYPWQKYLMERCLEEPDDRHIIWIYDPKGCNGKSKFTKYMSWKHNAQFLTYARAENLLALACKKISKCYLFDLSRTKPMDISGQDIYSAMEQIKNGMICQTKYQVETICFDPPHVVIFANQLPEMHRLTTDRWIIMTINGDKELVHYVPSAGV